MVITFTIIIIDFFNNSTWGLEPKGTLFFEFTDENILLKECC